MNKAHNVIESLASQSTKTKSKIRKSNPKCISIDSDILKIYNQIHEKVDKIHQEILRVVAGADVIFIPKLQVQQILRKKTGKNLSGITKSCLSLLRHAELLKKISTQCSKIGGSLVLTNEAFSTKRLSCCGRINSGIGGTKRVVCNHCNYAIHRDINGAWNILLFGLARTLSCLEKRRKGNFVSLYEH